MPETRTRALEMSECYELLRGRGWGVLSTIESPTGRPYAVPVAYAIDGDAIYIATGRGRKSRALASNPGVCLTVTDVERFDCWRSVVVIGTVRWISATAERAAALLAFVRQQRPGGAALPRGAARLVTAQIFRIDVVELSGRGDRSGCTADRPA